MTPPTLPVGPAPEPGPEAPTRDAVRPALDSLAEAPARLAGALEGLTPDQLDTPYRNWTVRQIAHHLPDSHLNAYTRCMLALTEETPAIRPYDEGAWSELDVSRTGDVRLAIALLGSVHAKWDALLRTLSGEQLARRFRHPEHGAEFRVGDMPRLYDWHARHHTAQIAWLRDHHGWG